MKENPLLSVAFLAYPTYPGLAKGPRRPQIVEDFCILMATSRLQSLTKRKLQYVFEPMGYKVIENSRPSWLNPPSAKRPLELDLFIPELNVAVEVHGVQHFKHVKFFHKTENDYLRAIELDQQKRIACAEHGILLSEIANKKQIDETVRRIGIMVPGNPLQIYNARKYRKRYKLQMSEGIILAICIFFGEYQIIKFQAAKDVKRYKDNLKQHLVEMYIKQSYTNGESVFYDKLLEMGKFNRVIGDFTKII